MHNRERNINAGMEIFVIVVVSFSASMLTFFAGFGLGTMLMPVFALFMPVELAIASTGIVHFINNIFKFGLVRRHINWQTVWRFGLPAIIGAIIGAWLLGQISDWPGMATYCLGTKCYTITPVKLVVGLLLMLFAGIEIMPKSRQPVFSPQMMVPGGLVSGFFGGLSGHQGALRTAFLIRSGLDMTAFIATGIAIACLIDIGRLSVYARTALQTEWQLQTKLILTAVLAALAGAFAGHRLLRKMTFDLVQKLVFILLLSLSLLMMAGII